MKHDPYPKITIATVTYNAEKSLQATLDSVASQTYPNIEHLIIDGCSKDQTMELIHRYVDSNTGKQIPHDIKVIREPDKGLYDAMNKAIEHAEGEYICFLNAGDRLHQADTIQKITEQIRVNEESPAVIYGETDLVDATGRFLRHRRLQIPEQLHWKSFLQGMLVCHQSFYVRTDLARKEHYDLKYRYSADYDWCIRIMKQAVSRNMVLHNTHLILTDYLSEGLTTQNHKKSLFERLRIMAHHYSWPVAVYQHLWFIVRAVIKH